MDKKVSKEDINKALMDAGVGQDCPDVKRVMKHLFPEYGWRDISSTCELVFRNGNVSIYDNESHMYLVALGSFEAESSNSKEKFEVRKESYIGFIFKIKGDKIYRKIT